MLAGWAKCKMQIYQYLIPLSSSEQILLLNPHYLDPLKYKPMPILHSVLQLLLLHLRQSSLQNLYLLLGLRLQESHHKHLSIDPEILAYPRGLINDRNIMVVKEYYKYALLADHIEFDKCNNEEAVVLPAVCAAFNSVVFHTDE